MINTLTQPNRGKAGYLDVKLPPRLRGLRWKAWRRRWVVFRALADLTESKPMARLSLFPSEEAYQRRRPKDKVHTVYLEDVGKVLRTKSRTHPYAFVVMSVDSKETLLYLAANSESITQEWITVLRDTFWAEYSADVTVDIGQAYYEVSVVDNDFSQRLSLFGRLLLVVSQSALSLYDPKEGALIHEWRLNHLARFHLGDSYAPEDENRILVIEAGEVCPSGSGAFYFFTSDSRSVLNCIYRVLMRGPNRKSTELPCEKALSDNRPAPNGSQNCYLFKRRYSEGSLHSSASLPADQGRVQLQQERRRRSLPCELDMGVQSFLAAKYDHPGIHLPESPSMFYTIDPDLESLNREKINRPDVAETTSLTDQIDRMNYRNLKVKAKRELFQRRESGLGTSTPSFETSLTSDVQGVFSVIEVPKDRTVSVSSALSVSSRDSGVALQSSESSAISNEDIGTSRRQILQQKQIGHVDTAQSSYDSTGSLRLTETFEDLLISPLTEVAIDKHDNPTSYVDIWENLSSEEEATAGNGTESPLGESFSDIRPTTYSESEADDETDDETNMFQHRRRSYRRKISSVLTNHHEHPPAVRTVDSRCGTNLYPIEPPPLPPRPAREIVSSESHTGEEHPRRDRRRCISDTTSRTAVGLDVTGSSEGGRLTDDSADEETVLTSSTVSRKTSTTSQVTLTALGSQASLNKTPAHCNHLSLPLLRERTASNPELYRKKCCPDKHGLTQETCSSRGIMIPYISEEVDGGSRLSEESPRKCSSILRRPKSHSDLAGVINEYENSILRGHRTQRQQSYSSCENLLAPVVSKQEISENNHAIDALRKISTHTYLDLDAILPPTADTEEEEQQEAELPPELPPRCSRRSGIMNTDEIYEDPDRFRKNLRAFLGMPDSIHDPPPPVPVRPPTLPPLPKVRSRLGTLVRRRKQLRRRKHGRGELQGFTSEEDGQLGDVTSRVRQVSAWPLPDQPAASQEATNRRSLVTDNEIYSFSPPPLSPGLVASPANNATVGFVSCGNCGAVGRVEPCQPLPNGAPVSVQSTSTLPLSSPFPNLLQTPQPAWETEGAYFGGSESSYSDSSVGDVMSGNTFVRRPRPYLLDTHNSRRMTLTKRLSDPVMTSDLPTQADPRPEQSPANSVRVCPLRRRLNSQSSEPRTRTTTWYIPSAPMEGDTPPQHVRSPTVDHSRPIDMIGEHIAAVPPTPVILCEPPRYMNFMEAVMTNRDLSERPGGPGEGIYMRMDRGSAGYAGHEASRTDHTDAVREENFYMSMQEDVFGMSDV